MLCRGAYDYSRSESHFYRFQEIDIDPEQQRLLEGLDGRTRLGEFLEAPEPLRRTLYALLATGMLELCENAPSEPEAVRTHAARAVTSTPEPEPGEALPPEAAAKPFASDGAATPAELVELAESFRGRSYFEILGVSPESGSAQLDRAYEQLSARTHPDRFSAAGESARDLAAELFEQVTQAYETLSDPHLRQAYVLDCQSRERNQAKRDRAERALEAESEFQRGQAALNSREYEMALLHFGRALQLYPDEGDHHAHYGWALHLCHPGDPAMVAEAIEHVKRGLKLASHREKPYLFMGRLYRAVGRVDTAEKMFTRAVQIQPECVEALRELRLINMRREKSRGLLGRLFRRS